MTLNFTFTQEQADALTGVVAFENSSLPVEAQAYTAESYLTNLVTIAVNDYVAAAYASAVQRIGAAAASLSYEDRQALISQLETQLNP